LISRVLAHFCDNAFRPPESIFNLIERSHVEGPVYDARGYGSGELYKRANPTCG
jgi:hypothetical protein